MIEVTQEDRDVAGVVLGEMVLGNEDRAEAAVARHRAAAEQRGMLAGARLALEAAANGLEAHAKHYTEMKDAAKERKDKREVRDFETMAMACAFRSAEIRALDPAAIATMPMPAGGEDA